MGRERESVGMTLRFFCVNKGLPFRDSGTDRSFVQVFMCHVPSFSKEKTRKRTVEERTKRFRGGRGSQSSGTRKVYQSEVPLSSSEWSISQDSVCLYGDKLPLPGPDLKSR